MKEIKQLNDVFGIQYSGSISYYIFDDEEILIEELLPDNLQSLPLNALHNPFTICNFAGQNFTYSAGFVEGKSVYYFLLEISMRHIDRMNSFLKDQKSHILIFLIEHYKMLGARDLVMGIDCQFEDLVSYLNGYPSENLLRTNIVMTIPVPNNSTNSFIAFGGENLVVKNVSVNARWIQNW